MKSVNTKNYGNAHYNMFNSLENGYCPGNDGIIFMSTALTSYYLYLRNFETNVSEFPENIEKCSV